MSKYIKKPTTWRRTTEQKKINHNWNGIAGRQRGQQPMTGTDGRRVSRPGVPSGTKRLGEEIIVIDMNSAV